MIAQQCSSNPLRATDEWICQVVDCESGKEAFIIVKRGWTDRSSPPNRRLLFGVGRTAGYAVADSYSTDSVVRFGLGQLQRIFHRSDGVDCVAFGDVR